MSNLLELKSNPGARKRSRRVGRGSGSGLGTYAGRGMNGQNSRTGGGVRPGFEGGQTPVYRKMPKLKGFRNVNRVEFQPVNVDQLNTFEDGTEVDITLLYERKLIKRKDQPVKILGNGELTKKLTIKAEKFSASAKEKIEKAKGNIVEFMGKTTEKAKAESKKTAKTKASAEAEPAKE